MERKDDKKASSSMMVLPTAVLGILMVVIIVFLVSINANIGKLVAAGSVVKQQVAAVPTPTPQLPAPTEIAAGSNPILGEKNAPVQIIEFSDFECPFCQRFYDDTMGQIETNYVKTGKVQVSFRYFPLSFHPNAQKAAEAAACANDQGKFWDMHDTLFSKKTLDIASLKQHAKDLGLDTTKFNDCLDSGKFASLVQKDESEGQAAGVSGTPTFFVNGQKIVGAQPYQVFDQAIQQALSAK